MSLLEDVFLEDEAGEAQELERVIEGDEYDERPRTPNSDENSEKEDEAEEDKRRVDPTQSKKVRVVKNPRFILNPARLTGPRGIQVIPEHFKDFKFKGKGHEKDDLDMILKKLEHWAYRLYPKFKFEDCLKKIETLGKKRPVMVHLHKIRSDQFVSEETVVQQDSSDDELPQPPQEEDEFDKLLQQQIDLARATPAPGSVQKPGMATPRYVVSMPKATSSPSINDQQRERMLQNRRMAEERRLARLKNANNTLTTIKVATINEGNEPKDLDIDVAKIKKHNRSNVIDSSDEETVNHLTPDVNIDAEITIEPNNTADTNLNTEINLDARNIDNDKTEPNKKSTNETHIIVTDKNTENSVTNNVDKEKVIENDKLKCSDDLEENANTEIQCTKEVSLDNVASESKTNLQENAIVTETKDDQSNKDEMETVLVSTENSGTVNNEVLEDDIMDVDFTDDF